MYNTTTLALREETEGKRNYDLKISRGPILLFRARSNSDSLTTCNRSSTLWSLTWWQLLGVHELGNRDFLLWYFG